MDTPVSSPCGPTNLYAAITAFRQRWAWKRTVSALFDRVDAIDRAEEVGAARRGSTLGPQSGIAFVAVNVPLLLTIARQALASVQEDMLEAIGHQMATEEKTVTPAPMLPAGTILSCPQCEEGVSKSTTRARIEDVVLEDGVILHPLNITIPKREAWGA